MNAHLAAGLAAADAQAPSWVNTGAIIGLITLAVMLIGSYIGIQMMGRSGRTKPADQAKTGLNVLLGAGVIALAIGGGLWIIAQQSTDFFISK